MALFGYDQGVFGGVNVTQDYLDTMGFGPTSSTLSTVTAVYGDLLGRKKTIMLGTTIMLIGAILQVSAFGVPQMMVARVIAGIGNGLNTATAPVWQSETSKASMRGKLVVIEMVCNIAGFSLSNWITYGFSFASGPIVWRFPIAFQIVFMIVLYATVPWLPESPRWLMAKGRVEESEQITADLESTTVDDPYIVTVSKEMQYSINQEREAAVPFKDLFLGRTGGKAGTKTLRRLFLGMGTQAMQQFGGINVTSYYLPTVLEQSVGLSTDMARLIAACNSVSYLIFGSLGIPVVESMGRRFLMLFSSFGQFVCYAIITGLLSQVVLGDPSTTKYGEASIAFFFLYYVFFGFGWQGIPWLYPAEVNSLGMRTRGAALGTATNWIVNFMVVEITPPGIGSLGWKFYIIWTVFNFSFLPIVYFLYPETAGRTLEDLDRFFREDPPLLVFRDKAATSKHRPDKYLAHEQQEVRRHSSVGSVSAKTAAELYRNSMSSQDGGEKDDIEKVERTAGL
ncbi:MAG: hypothetical protein Q9162_004843 [Coniocarpon cinnabarinum]